MGEKTYTEIFVNMVNHFMLCKETEENCSICYDLKEVESILDGHEET